MRVRGTGSAGGRSGGSGAAGHATGGGSVVGQRVFVGVGLISSRFAAT
jgi:hypothetical protein